MHEKQFWILTDKCENNLKHENEADRNGNSASFSYSRFFPHLLVKIQNCFLCMCWRKMFCFSDHSSWETKLKSVSFKVVLIWNNYRKGLLYHWSGSDATVLKSYLQEIPLSAKIIPNHTQRWEGGYNKEYPQCNTFLWQQDQTQAASSDRRRSRNSSSSSVFSLSETMTRSLPSGGTAVLEELRATIRHKEGELASTKVSGCGVGKYIGISITAFKRFPPQIHLHITTQWSIIYIVFCFHTHSLPFQHWSQVENLWPKNWPHL